jgi:hypothetical protein
LVDRIHVATRKGLIILDRVEARHWRINHTVFVGEPVTVVLPDRRDGTVYAGLKLGHFGPKLRRSRDGGKTWSECAEPRFPAIGKKRSGEAKAPSVFQLWSLEAGGVDRPGVLWAGTIPGGLFRSRDGAESWELIESLWKRPERQEWLGGGYDDPGIHSICVDSRNSRRVTVGVSVGGVWATDDDGANWESRAQGMRAAYMPAERAFDQNVQDPHRVVRCPANPEVFWAQHHNGIFRSTDGAASWSEIKDVNPSSFGFTVAVHPNDPDTAWFVPAQKDECRVPVDNQLVVTRTRDGGQSFEILHHGLPQDTSFDLVYRHSLDVDATGNSLVMGSTTGNLWISEDQGDSWQAVSSHLPPIYCTRFA